ncbi:hypothetical protein RHMOL_Rhmol03G0003800 [Rhododendron molle]|uniref:Uncharacterized protein n=1 Tax=Rhododendron molle TaxID=49168 RepID=A0ACC0PAJ3_RHOML|nr:hypothetical protein RHMOL_Rhmol03G0003800 [Rhododendron molle]
MDFKSPLLPNEGPKSNRKRNSVASIKRDFFSKLPEKVRSGLDPETPFQIDLSKITGLIEGEKEYYERQLATLKSFEEVDSIDASHVIDEEQDKEEQMQHERAMNISNVANVLLLVFKIYATVRSGSLAIAASTLDSLLDLMAGGILWFTHLSMTNINIYKYPIGKLRVQPVGIIIFAAVMATLGFQVLIQAVEKLIEDEPSEKMNSGQLIWLYTIMLTATGIKLVLWIYCRRSSNKIVRAYAKDHYFDVVTNMVGLIAAVLGDKFYWWIDPVGAIILAVYTIANWSGTVLENAGYFSLSKRNLSTNLNLFRMRNSFYCVPGWTISSPRSFAEANLFGLEAPSSNQTGRHCPRLHLWCSLFRRVVFLYEYVQVDIELPEDLPLKEAHAIGESLQIKIEELAEVERAFVHLDYECDHKPEHSVLSRLPNSQP